MNWIPSIIMRAEWRSGRLVVLSAFLMRAASCYAQGISPVMASPIPAVPRAAAGFVTPELLTHLKIHTVPQSNVQQVHLNLYAQIPTVPVSAHQASTLGSAPPGIIEAPLGSIRIVTPTLLQSAEIPTVPLTSIQPTPAPSP